MALDRSDISILKEAFTDALRDSSRGGFGLTGGRTGQVSTGQNVLTNALNGVTNELTGLGKAAAGVAVDSFGKLSSGNMRLSDAGNILGDNLKKSGTILGETFGGLGHIAGSALKFYEDGLDSFRLLSENGMNFNNSLVDLRESAAGTRLTLSEFNNLMQKNATSFAQLSGGAAEGSKMFAEASQKMFDDSGLIDRMTALGFTSNDLNQLLATTYVQQRRTGIDEKTARDNAIKQVEELGKEMDKVAKLTGISRKEQEDAMRKQQENGQLRAALDNALEAGGKGVVEAYNAQARAAQLGGKDFEKLSEQIFAMGRPTEEMALKFQAIGPAAQKLLYEASEASKAGKTELAKRLTEEAAAAAAIAQQTKTNRDLAQQGIQDFADLNSSTRALGDNLKQVAKQNNLNLQTEEGRRKAIAIMNADVEKQQTATNGLTQTMNLAENTMKDASAGIQQGVVRPFKSGTPVDKAITDFFNSQAAAKGSPNEVREKTAGTLQKGLDDLTKVLSGLDPVLARRISAVDEGLKIAREKGTGVDTDATKAFTIYLAESKDLQRNIAKEAKEKKISEEEVIKRIVAAGPEAIKKSIDDANKATTQRIEKEKKRESMSPEEQRLERIKERRQSGPGESLLERFSTEVFKASTLEVTNFPQMDKLLNRSTGSLGAAGKLIEDFGSGTLAMLHGKEGVITEAQLKDIVSTASMSARLKSSPTTRSLAAQGIETAETTETAGPTAAKPSLEDVVGSLNTLNSTMNKLLESHLDIGMKQIQAVRSNNANIFERA